MIIHVFKNHYHEFSLQRIYNNWRLPSTASERLNFHNTVQAIYGVATEREQHRLLRSAVTEDTLYQRPEGTRQTLEHELP